MGICEWVLSLKRKHTIIIGIGIIIVFIVGILQASIPRMQVIYHEEYSDIDFYPDYYVANFTITRSYYHPELIIDIDVERGDNGCSYLISWRLYNETVQDFQESFNITEAKSYFESYWGGWQAGDVGFPLDMQRELPLGSYVFVFWIEPEEPASGWSVEMTLNLRTYLIKLF